MFYCGGNVALAFNAVIVNPNLPKEHPVSKCDERIPLRHPVLDFLQYIPKGGCPALFSVRTRRRPGYAMYVTLSRLPLFEVSLNAEYWVLKIPICVYQIQDFPDSGALHLVTGAISYNHRISICPYVSTK